MPSNRLAVVAGCVLLLLAGCGPRAPTEAMRAEPEAVPLSERYPIALAPGGRALIDRQGRPFLIQGDAAWSLMAQLKREEVTVYLRRRRQQQFNTILVNLIEHEFADRPPRNAYGERPFTRGNRFDRPNEAYFRHVDWVLAEAVRHEMLVVVCYCYLGFGCGSEGWSAEISRNGVDRCRQWGRYLGRRYARFPNIVWLAGGDASAEKCGVAAEVDAMAWGLKETDANHLHAAHSYRHRSAVDDYDRPWLDLNTTYSNAERALDQLRRDAERSDRPFIFIEGDYEAEGASRVAVRRQAYWSLLAGAVGHIYGHRDVWRFDPDWQAALDSPGAQDMQRLAAAVASRPWWRLRAEPGGDLVRAGGAGVAAALMADGGILAVYLPEAQPVTVDLGRLSAADVTAWWHQPETGGVQPAGRFARAGAHTFIPPGPGDWLLVAEVQEAQRSRETHEDVSPVHAGIDE